MTPTINTQCPHCGKDITITGIKLNFDNPKPEPIKSNQKGYVGWQGDKKEEVSSKMPLLSGSYHVDNTGDPNEDVRKLVQEAVDKTPQPYVDPNPNNERVVLNPAPDKDEFDQLKKIIDEKPLIDKSAVKQSVKEDELIPLLKKLTLLLDEKVYPELHTFITALMGEETKKEEHNNERKISIW